MTWLGYSPHLISLSPTEGYSSISVREPLANLKARNPEMNVGRQRIGASQHHQQPDSLDPHYATVSDVEDSDEMYAAIAEVQPIYESGAGSDTYAKINDRSDNQPVASTSNGAAALSASAAASPVPNAHMEVERLNSSPVPPTPPSVVSLRQLSSASSRLHGNLYTSCMRIELSSFKTQLFFDYLQLLH